MSTSILEYVSNSCVRCDVSLRKSKILLGRKNNFSKCELRTQLIKLFRQ